ncbi:transcription initiation factor TFIID subunit 4-like isoform X2 [Salarias fasciatus]|uniref:transcription initiation factor TFIID subunit 4-like isoform X2 n=1 Tax=Salarias fasciatus TaxID=181472 RepID=UPI0011768461|nr:transcription initiation factor TFIID subunit 4-like isoform X2 [Salarias fasciatus]
MAGASDPLEDMLFTEVDEKAVSDLVGSLESQLGDRTDKREASAAAPAAAAPAAGHFSGKDPGSAEPQQGRPRAALTPEPGSGRAAASSSASSAPAAAALLPGGADSPGAGPGPGPGTQPAAAAAGFPRAAAPGAPAVAPETRTSSPGVQSVNGGPGAVKPGTGSSAAPQPGFQVPQPAAGLQKTPGVAQNGVDPKGAPLAAPAGSAGPALNHSGPLIHTKMLLPGQPAPGGPVILTGTPPPAPAQSPVGQPGTGTPPAATVALTPGAKPAVNGVAVVRPPGAPVVATSIQQQRPGLGTGTPARAPAPQPALAVRPQQQTTIQLQPGFTLPPGMVLVRTETGQLVMVPQQVLAQAQAKTQQSQTVAGIAQRPAAPTAGATIRVSTAATAPGAPQTVRLTSPPQTRLVQPAVTVQALATPPVGGAVPVKMAAPLKSPTVISAGGAKPASTPPPPAARVSVVSQEMQENVKKCKNFLATLIKLASHNAPCPDTSKNVKALVQDLLDAKIEPEEFTTRLQAELKSSPQPYLIPFLKKSLPALRQSLLNSQQSLMTAPPSSSAPPPVAPGSGASIRPRLSVEAGGAVRLNTPMSNTTAVTVGRGSVQTVQTRTPVVISQTFRPQGTLIRGPAIIAGKTPINLAAQANQKKLSDPGGGTFRDDDDINDVASMAGVNLNEENARILATSSELVGTKIRSCKDESFLPTGLLHRRILETAKKLGVSEVPLDVVNLVSHATQSRLRSLLEKVSAVAQHRADGGKDEEHYEQSSDVRSQLRFFEQLERMEKQRKDEQEREILLKAAKSRARQEDPEQARLKQKAKEMQQQELAQMRQRDANLTALAAIGPRKKRKLDSPGGATAGGEAACGPASSSSGSASSAASTRQQLRQRITRVNLRDFIFCLEQERSTARSLTLYKALLK